MKWKHLIQTKPAAFTCFVIYSVKIGKLLNQNLTYIKKWSFGLNH